MISGRNIAAGFAHMASLVVQWTSQLHEDSDVHQDPSLPANVDESYFLRVSSALEARHAGVWLRISAGSPFSSLECPCGRAVASMLGLC